MKRVVFTVFIVAAIALAFAAGQRSPRHSARWSSSVPHRPVPQSEAPARSEQAAEKHQLYQCSMHPQIVSEKPGKCPICQMELEPVIETTPEAAGGQATADKRILFYRHPMRPEITSPTPMKDEMGMDYVPVYADEAGGQTTNVPGHAAFTLSPERQQLIGVRRGRVETKDLARSIRTVGKVAYDPELYRAIVEYRQAAGRGGVEAFASTAALRLRQMGLSPDVIKAMALPSHDPESLLLPGKEVWVYAQVFEYELDLVRPGQPVSVVTPSLPQRTYGAEVVAVDSVLNPTTRSARARILVSTPKGDLRPETFVHVNIDVPLGRKLAVPAEAVLDTGEQQIVFVVHGVTFEPRSVELGARAQDDYEVLRGLQESEEVVTSANFLIDSESRFRAAVAAFKNTAPAANEEH